MTSHPQLSECYLISTPFILRSFTSKKPNLVDHGSYNRDQRSPHYRKVPKEGQKKTWHRLPTPTTRYHFRRKEMAKRQMRPDSWVCVTSYPNRLPWPNWNSTWHWEIKNLCRCHNFVPGKKELLHKVCTRLVRESHDGNRSHLGERHCECPTTNCVCTKGSFTPALPRQEGVVHRIVLYQQKSKEVAKDCLKIARRNNEIKHIWNEMLGVANTMRGTWRGCQNELWTLNR